MIRHMQQALLLSLAYQNKTEGYLEGQLDKIHQECTYWIQSFAEYLPMNLWYPIAGPFEANAKVGNHNFKLSFSGLLRRPQFHTVAAVIFSPYENDLANLNDLLSLFKVKILEPTVQEFYQDKTVKVRAHIFGRSYTNKVLYQNYTNHDIDNCFLKVLNTAATLMKNDFDIPRMACKEKHCPIRNKCTFLKEKK